MTKWQNDGQPANLTYDAIANGVPKKIEKKDLLSLAIHADKVQWKE
jgi:hypothetical protein